MLLAWASNSQADCQLGPSGSARFRKRRSTSRRSLPRMRPHLSPRSDRLRRWGTDGLHDSSLEGTGFELLVRRRVKLVDGRRRQRNRTARRSRCRSPSVTFDQLVACTRAGGQGHRCARPLGRGPHRGRRFNRSRDRARYRYYEGSRSGPAVTAERREILLEGLIDMGSRCLTRPSRAR